MANKFKFEALSVTTHGEVVAAKLGVDANNKLVDADVGKAVKLAANDNYVPVTAGDELEGFVSSIQPFTDNGFSFGSVQTKGYIEAIVGANQGATPMAVRDFVVADVPVALGTAGQAKVKTGTPATFKWRVLRIISGTGVAGDKVLIKREA